MQFFLCIFYGASSQHLHLLVTFQESIFSALILSVSLVCFPNQSSCPGLALLQSLILSGGRWLHDLVNLRVPGYFWYQHHGEVPMGLLETFLESSRALPWSSGSCLNRGTVQLVVPPSDAIHFIYIMNWGLWTIRIGFGKQSNPEELGTPWKGFGLDRKSVV